MFESNLKRFTALCIGIVLLVICIFFCELLNQPGADYTVAYEAYNDLKELSSLEDVENYLNSKCISYEINNSKLTLPDCDSIVYIINPDNDTGYLSHSSIMHNLSKLDARNFDRVMVTNTFINNTPTEVTYLWNKGCLYTKLANHYYVEPTLFYAAIMLINFITAIIILPCVIIDYIGVFFDWLKERKNKKHTNKTSEANPETENCES